MYLHQLFRSFHPLQNPIGFGVEDFVTFAMALLLGAALLIGAAMAPAIAKITKRTPLAMAVLALSSVALRLMLLRTSPAPVPAGADDFGYILLADTLGSLRLANPTHALYRFFEAVFVLQQPTYSSIFPLGQGLVLAAGKLLFGSYWAGVLLAAGCLAALCYWMLRGWMPPRWAMAGGILAILQFGPLCSWTNSYWGGAVSACAGCLVFGALPRLRVAGRKPDVRSVRANALLLGLGLGLQLLTRPFESVLLLLSVVLYFAWCLRNRQILLRVLLVGSLVTAPAIGLMLFQNKRVTGSWTTLPYQLSRYQYGVPTTFFWQPNPTPHRALTPEQDLDYRAQAAIHGQSENSGAAFWRRLFERSGYLRFFVPVSLCLPMLFFLRSMKRASRRWVLATLALFFMGTNFYPYFFPHYIAAVTCLIVLAAVEGLRNLSVVRPGGIRAGRLASRWALVLCAAHFVFWYGLHFTGSSKLQPAFAYETWDFITFGDPEGRLAVADELARAPGQQLVFVHYAPQHRFGEWIANAATIDTARVVWAHDLGSGENQNLLHYFPARRAWLLEPDAHPPKLTPYSASTFESVP